MNENPAKINKIQLLKLVISRHFENRYLRADPKMKNSEWSVKPGKEEFPSEVIQKIQMKTYYCLII